MWLRDKKGISVNYLHVIVTNTTVGANCGVGDTVVEYSRVM
jgi:hypothetical protein